MKLSTLLFFICIFGLAAENVHPQQKELSLNLKNVTIKKAISEIEKTSDYLFLITDEAKTELNKRTSISVNKKSINTILETILKGTDLKYHVVERQVSLYKDTESKIPKAPVTTAEEIEQQKRQIRGQVTDNEGIPIIGANIVESGTTNGTVTDLDGNFTLNAEENAVIQITYIGYLSQNINTAGKTNFEIILLEDTQSLEELVVVGYGVQKKANVTGAVSTIQADEIIANRPVTNAFSGLQGVVPGLQVTYDSGRPGDTGLSMNIRGTTSINGGSPLILLDNVPVSSEDVNPADVESITVLKDASASAIYGARAAFGVILITTKKGKKNKPIKFNYSTTMSFNKPMDLPEKAGVYDFIHALNDFGVQSYWTGQDINTWVNYLDEYKNDPTLYPEGYAVADGGQRYLLVDQDAAAGYFGDTGFTQIHNFNFNGGTEKTAFRVSLGYSNQDGVIVTDNDSYEKYNFKSYLKADLTSKLSMSVDVSIRRSNLKAPIGGYSNMIRYKPWAPIDGEYEIDGVSYPYNTPVNNEYLNPAPVTKRNNYRLLGEAIYKVINGLNVHAEYTFESKGSDYTSQNNQVQTVNPERLSLEGVNPDNTYYYLSNTKSTYNALNLYAKYTKNFGGHHLATIVGMNNEKYSAESHWVRRLGLISVDLPSISTATGTITAEDGFNEWAVLGGFGRLNYNYNEKYFLEVSGRYDGSSRFPSENRFDFFPSFSVGWNLRNEDFMNHVDAISLLKLRASYGTIGNQAIENTLGNYAAIPGMPTGDANWLNPSSGTKYLTIGPPDLVSSSFTWEEVRTKNVGIDLRAFEGRFSTSFDAFERETIGMLTAGAQLPGILGTSAPDQNAADLKSYGWELEMTWGDRKGDFSYNVGFSLSDNQAEITKFDNEAGLINQYYVGRKIGEIWGFVTDGYYSVDDFVEGTLSDNLTGGTLKEGIPYYKGTSPNPGDTKYKDLDGDGVIFTGDGTLKADYDENGNMIPDTGPGDRKVIGNNRRRYQYGIHGDVKYKNFDFSFVLSGVGKRDLWLNNNVRFGYQDEFAPMFTEQLDYWTVNNTDAKYPRNYTNGGTNYGNSTRVQTKYLLNGAYLNIQNITVGYNIPTSLLKRINVDRLRIYASVENLYNFNNWPKGINTELEIIASGANYPLLRGYNFGINLTF